LARPTLYLHVGVHRTATSSIQAYLAQNIEALKAQGIVLPNGRGRHIGLVNKLYSDAAGESDDARKFVISQAQRRGFARPKAVIVSDEDIALRPEITPFLPLRDSFDIKVIVALRRQDLWLESWYFQNIKWQWNDDLAHLTFDEFMTKIDDFHWIDYDRYLGMLEQAFGQANVFPFVFERSEMPDGPVAAFAKLAGIDTRDLTLPPHRNASLSPLMTEFIRRFPLENAKPAARARIEQAFIRTDAQLDKAPDEASALLLPPDRRRDVLARFETGNRAVAQRYFGRDELFRDPLPAEDATLGRLALPADAEELMQRLVEPVLQKLISQIDEMVK